MHGELSYVLAKIEGKNNIYSEWSHSTYGMNTNIPYEIKQGEPITFSLVLNLSETGNAIDVKKENYTGYKLSLYIDGKEKMHSYLNIKQWDEFKKVYMGKTDTFDLGVYRNYWPGSINDFAYLYGKMSLKNLRFYTRPLSAEEIKLNYDTRLAYDGNNSESD